MSARIRVSDYGRLPSGDPRLWPVPTVGGRRQRHMHWAAALALSALQRAWEASGGGGVILVASGWRRHRWRSRAHYEATLVDRYGSVAEGRRWLAYDSPHETGLAMDVGSLGLWPTRRTIDRQRRTTLWHWLDAHAAESGWAPYPAEPWHWEHVGTSPAVWALEGPEAVG